MKGVYYNEFDAVAAQWLRELIRSGHLPDGDVDERSIAEVEAADVRGYRACHWFAGIGGWPYALRLASLPDDFRGWTGSCPCQPFSSAGKRKGNADARHLWPEMFRLVRECRPDVVFGEQVEGAIGHGWLDGVFADLEGEGYACGAAVLGAHSAGAPHIRQRLFWVADRLADAGQEQRGRRADECRPDGDDAAQRRQEATDDQRRGSVGGVADDKEQRRPQRDQDTGGSLEGVRAEGHGSGPADARNARRLADPDGRQARHRGLQPGGEHGQQPADGGVGGGVGDPESRRRSAATRPGEAAQERPADANTGPDGQLQARPVGPSGADFWSDSTLIPCRDGKSRRVPRGVEPGVLAVADGLSAAVATGRLEGRDYHPLAQGKVPGRVGVLRGAGNAIVPQVAAVFIRAWMASRGIVEG